VFLVKNSYTILDKNLRLKTSEVDIIALDTQYHEVVFFEVKRRKTAFFGSPTLAVSPQKIKSMHKVARAFLKKHRYPCDYRFDIISIVGTNIEHFKNITWLT